MVAALTLALAFPSKFVVVGRLLIGQLKGKQWANVPESARTERTLTLLGVKLSSLGGKLTVKGFGADDDVGGVFVRSEHYEDSVWTYGLRPSWPRAIKVLDVKSKTYLGALGELLKARGLQSEPNLTALYSVDLDGDGTQEVIAEASSKGYSQESTADPKPGDYSVVFLRAVGKKGVLTSILYGGFKASEGIDFGRIRSIVDLEGDGKMEVIISDDYYEGQEASIWSFRAGKLKKLCSAAAGV